MRYFGGKARTAKKISEVLHQHRTKGQLYIEPFVGGGWILSEMRGPKLANDANQYLIAMYKALQSGWIPPSVVTKEDYERAKRLELSDELIAFIGFGCSFAGKWFGGYAKSGDRNYASNAANSLAKKLPGLRDCEFVSKDYREFDPVDSLVYCDPPYCGTTQYGAVGNFDSSEFWQVMRKWSESNTVIISEYQAPADFECIAAFETKLDIRNSDNQKEPRVEKLFKLRST
jgi:DNA adenine methylase